MKAFWIGSGFMFFAVFLSAQNSPSLRLSSISAEFKIVSQAYDQVLFGDMVMLMKDPSLFTPIDLTAYHTGAYTINFAVASMKFESPGTPVNRYNLLTDARYSIKASFRMLNHNTDAYYDKRSLSLSLFYQPWLYHKTEYSRTDTITPDSLHLNYVSYDEWSPMLGVEAGYFFNTSNTKWISAYVGIAGALAGSVHAQIAETFGVMTIKIATDSTGGSSFPVYIPGVLSNTQNVFKSKSSLLLEGKIPAGISLKIINELNLYLQVEVVLSKQIYLSGTTSFPPTLSLNEAAGLQLNF